MKVKALIAELTKVDQEAEVVVSAFDHGYRKVCRASRARAEVHRGGELSEYYDKRNMSDEGNSVVPVVVLE